MEVVIIIILCIVIAYVSFKYLQIKKQLEDQKFDHTNKTSQLDIIKKTNLNEGQENKKEDHREKDILFEKDDVNEFDNKNELDQAKSNDIKKSFLSEILFQILDSNSSELKQIKIGKLVRSTLPEILTSELISELEVNKLTTDDYSKMIFDMNYPVLRQVNEKKSIKENRTIGDYTRYYANAHTYKGKQYLVSSEWYDRNQEYYIKWLKRKILKN